MLLCTLSYIDVFLLYSFALLSPKYVILSVHFIAGSNASSQTQQANTRGGNHTRNTSEPRKRFLASGSSDEDPYSLTPSGSSGSSGKVYIE